MTTNAQVYQTQISYDLDKILNNNYLLYNLRVFSRFTMIEISNMEYNETAAPIIGETDAKARTRLLLTLWALGGSKGKIKKSELTSKVKQKRQGKKVGVYQGLYDDLKTDGAIQIEKENQVPMVSMTVTGQQMLLEAIRSPEFEFEGTVVASRMANGLIELIREIDGNIQVEAAPE